jgi:hypothetical protein
LSVWHREYKGKSKPSEKLLMSTKSREGHFWSAGAKDDSRDAEVLAPMRSGPIRAALPGVAFPSPACGSKDDGFRARHAM